MRYDANGASVMGGGFGRPHHPGRRSLFGQRGGGYVELLSGPAPGSVVVAKAATQLLSGDYVKPDWTAGTAAK